MIDDEFCKRLWSAVLANALFDAARGYFKIHPENDEALTWLHSADTGQGSFLWVCEVLDHDPVKVRDSWRRQLRLLARQHWENLEVCHEQSADSD